MSIDNMRDEIIKEYGPKIRGQDVKKMWDGQILRIYTSIQNRKKVPRKKKPPEPIFYEQMMMDFSGMGGSI